MSVRDWIETRWDYGTESKAREAFEWVEPRLAWMRGPFDERFELALRYVVHSLQRPGDELVRGHAFVIQLAGQRELELFEHAVDEMLLRWPGAPAWPDAFPHVFVALEVDSQSELELLLPRLLSLPAPRRALVCRDFVPDLWPWDVARTTWVPPFSASTWADVNWPPWVPQALRTMLAEHWAHPWEWAAHVAEVGAPVHPRPGLATREAYLHLWDDRGAWTNGLTWSPARLEEQPNREPLPIDWLIIQGTDSDEAGPLSVYLLEALARNCSLTGVPLWLRSMGRWSPGIPASILEGSALANTLHPALVDPRPVAGPVEVASYCSTGPMAICWLVLSDQGLANLLSNPWNQQLQFATRAPAGGEPWRLYVNGCELEQGPFQARPCIAPAAPGTSRLWTPGGAP